jgi:hypothetical protein
MLFVSSLALAVRIGQGDNNQDRLMDGGRNKAWLADF